MTKEGGRGERQGEEGAGGKEGGGGLKEPERRTGEEKLSSVGLPARRDSVTEEERGKGGFRLCCKQGTQTLSRYCSKGRQQRERARTKPGEGTKDESDLRTRVRLRLTLAFNLYHHHHFGPMQVAH